MPKAASTAKTSAQPNTMTGLAGWVEVFRAGSHTDSQGRAATFSGADLDQMAANHSLGAAPAVIGHPKQDAPAYAWVDQLRRDGDSLFARFKDINPAFEAGVKSGAYRNRSVSVYPDKQHGWRVRHVGWLGAAAPAIDGLQPVAFAAAEAECQEFAAPGYSLVWAVETMAQLLRAQREQLIADRGIDAANAVLPQWQIDSALQAAAQARDEFQQAEVDDDGTGPAPQFSKPGGSMTTFTQEQLDAAAAKAKQEAEDKARTEFAAKDAELARLRSERQAERIGAQIGQWKADGKVLPAEEAGLAEFMGALDDAGAEFSFSAADGKEAKKTPAQFFADFMAARTPLIKLGVRSAGAGNDPGTANADDPAAIAEAARTYMKEQADKGLTVSLPEAVARVTNAGKR